MAKMRLPISVCVDIPEPDTPGLDDAYPERGRHANVLVCPNDGVLVYKAWNQLWHEALTHEPHTCVISKEFMEKVGGCG